jgi:hypothetical protein
VANRTLSAISSPAAIVAGYYSLTHQSWLPLMSLGTVLVAAPFALAFVLPLKPVDALQAKRAYRRHALIWIGFAALVVSVGLVASLRPT